jgi:hypothetical protein
LLKKRYEGSWWLTWGEAMIAVVVVANNNAERSTVYDISYGREVVVDHDHSPTSGTKTTALFLA